MIRPKKSQQQTTDANGYLNITGVAPGAYNLVETKAPVGYELIKKNRLKSRLLKGIKQFSFIKKMILRQNYRKRGQWANGLAFRYRKCVWFGRNLALFYYYRQLGKKGA